MSSFAGAARRWWFDEEYKAELTSKAETGHWYVVAGDIPGRVCAIVYAGYKITTPDGKQIIVSPDIYKETLREVTHEEYVVSETAWQQRMAEKQRQIELCEAARLAHLQIQAQCLHERSDSRIVAAAAGCDIYDTMCQDCGKVLRRSWSTAYDRDPNDQVSDWDWWVREYKKLYKQIPNQADYSLVESIQDTNVPDHYRR